MRGDDQGQPDVFRLRDARAARPERPSPATHPTDGRRRSSGHVVGLHFGYAMSSSCASESRRHPALRSCVNLNQFFLERVLQHPARA